MSRSIGGNWVNPAEKGGGKGQREQGNGSSGNGDGGKGNKKGKRIKSKDTKKGDGS